MPASPIPSSDQLAPLLARFPGVQRVLLFGSVARGTARPDSDVDLGVLGGGFWDQLGVGAELGPLFGRDLHVIDLATASDWLRFEAARGRVLFERAAGAWVHYQAESAVRYFDVLRSGPDSDRREERGVHRVLFVSAPPAGLDWPPASSTRSRPECDDRPTRP